MNLGAMLSTLSSSILRDTAEPRLWSDAALTDYLNAATEAFILSAGVGRAVHDVTLQVGDHSVQIPAQMLRVDSVHRGTSPLRRSMDPLLDHSAEVPTIYHVVDEDAIDTNATVSEPVVLTVVGLQKPRPMQSQLDTPEFIDPVWHRALLYYAAWMAFSENDVEGMNTQNAELYRQKWLIELSRARGYDFKRRGGRTLFAQSQARFN